MLLKYFSHRGFSDYPVVGVTWEQAHAFCRWRTDYLEGATHQGAQVYRLPTEAEWEFAAFAPIATEDGLTIEGKVYPWQGYHPRRLEKDHRGQFQANFVRGRGDMMGMGGNLNDHATITAPVDAFWPNEFGLYCMAGNVNEWVLDVYRVLSSDDVQEYNPFRGNEYKVPIEEQTTIDGVDMKVPQIDSLGRVVFAYPVSKDSVSAYAKLDVRNYKDGDASSALDRNDWLSAVDPESATKKLYDPELPEDSEGFLTSKISNTTRVYKGGGWKDRAYWLNPGQRRYLEQTESRSDIGFRCAMSKVGAEDGDVR